jgi:hypothetical protein
MGVSGPPSSAISYQWSKDGQVIAGATSPNLFLSGTTLASAGLYSLAITTSAGTTKTDSLRLRVNDPGVVVYDVKGTGALATSKLNSTLSFEGLLLVDRDSEQSAFFWLTTIGTQKVCTIERRADMGCRSTGPSVGTTTVFALVANSGAYPALEREFIWLSGADALIQLRTSPAAYVLAPEKMSGQLNSLTLAEGVAIQTQNASLTLNKVQTLASRTNPQALESLEAAISRLAADYASKGYSIQSNSIEPN